MTVYIIAEAGTDNYKIGYTEGPVRARLRSLQTGNPRKLGITWQCAGAPKKMETELHRMLHAAKQSGEWYHLTFEELEMAVHWGYIEGMSYRPWSEEDEAREHTRKEMMP